MYRLEAMTVAPKKNALLAKKQTNKQTNKQTDCTFHPALKAGKTVKIRGKIQQRGCKQTFSIKKNSHRKRSPSSFDPENASAMKANLLHKGSALNVLDGEVLLLNLDPG